MYITFLSFTYVRITVTEAAYAPQVNYDSCGLDSRLVLHAICQLNTLYQHLSTKST